jgi:ABC-2 type transport system ATP-binding protein
MLIDEILAVGDESFQRKCMARIAERMDAGATLVLVSHDPSAVERICRRVVVLDDGAVAFDGATAEGLLFYHRLLGTTEARSRSLRPAEGQRAQLEVPELELLDDGGRPRAAYRTGEELAVRMRVRALERAERAVVALEVRDTRGEVCFRTDETVGDLDGETELSFRVPRLNLLGGDYDVAVGAYDQDAPASGLLDRVARFSVAHTLDGEGVADLRGTWSLVGRRETLGASTRRGRVRSEELR